MFVRKQEMLGEPDFQAVIVPRRCSHIDNMEIARKALHEAVEIKYFYEGTSSLLIGHQVVTVHAGDVVVINPYEMHATVDAGDERSGRYHLFMISLDFFEGGGPDLRGFFFAQRKSFQTLIQQDPGIGELLKTASEEYERQAPLWQMMIRGILMQVFSALMRGYAEVTTLVPQEDELHVYAVLEPALRRIRDGYAENITITELSQLCFISKEYFCRLFRRFTGKSTMEFLREYRLQIAHILLKTTEQDMAQIAVSCGFRDTNYFCRCYRQNYGHSPGRGRRQSGIQTQ